MLPTFPQASSVTYTRGIVTDIKPQISGLGFGLFPPVKRLEQQPPEPLLVIKRCLWRIMKLPVPPSHSESLCKLGKGALSPGRWRVELELDLPPALILLAGWPCTWVTSTLNGAALLVYLFFQPKASACSLPPFGLYDLNAGGCLVMGSPMKTPPALFHYGSHKCSPIQCQSFPCWEYARMIFPQFMLQTLSRLRSRANLCLRYLVDF